MRRHDTDHTIAVHRKTSQFKIAQTGLCSKEKFETAQSITSTGRCFAQPIISAFESLVQSIHQYNNDI